MNLSFQDSVLQQVRSHLIEQSSMNEAQRQNVKDTIERLETVVSDYAREAAHIRADGDLTGQGQARRLADLRENSLQRLHTIVDSEVVSLTKRMGELENELRPQPPASDPVLQFLKEQEIRTLLRDKDELEVRVAYQEWAVTGKDDDAMRAIENAPQAFPLITDPSILNAGQRGRAARHSPEAAQLLKQMREWLGILNSAVAQAKASIGYWSPATSA